MLLATNNIVAVYDDTGAIFPPRHSPTVDDDGNQADLSNQALEQRVLQRFKEQVRAARRLFFSRFCFSWYRQVSCSRACLPRVGVFAVVGLQFIFFLSAWHPLIPFSPHNKRPHNRADTIPCVIMPCFVGVPHALRASHTVTLVGRASWVCIG